MNITGQLAQIGDLAPELNQHPGEQKYNPRYYQKFTHIESLESV
jgi:hypothetical protein